MTLFTLVFVFLIEQLRPLPPANPVHSLLASYTGNVARQFNAGERRQGVFAWLLCRGCWVSCCCIFFWNLRVIC